MTSDDAGRIDRERRARPPIAARVSAIGYRRTGDCAGGDCAAGDCAAGAGAAGQVARLGPADASAGPAGSVARFGPAGVVAGPDSASAVRLCEAWRRRSMISGWATDDDWRVPEVDAVAAAACGGAGLAATCALLGAARGRAGVGIGETLTDLAALCYVLHADDPPLELIKPLAEGWAEAGLAGLSEATCEDPLTGLATVAYLRTRLGEVYREARHAGGCAADMYRLLVADLPRRLDPWDRLSVTILLCNDLRAAFPGGETLSLATPGRAVALVRAAAELPFRATGLRRSLAEDHGARLRLLRPPASHQEALRLLDGLAR